MSLSAPTRPLVAVTGVYIDSPSESTASEDFFAAATFSVTTPSPRDKSHDDARTMLSSTVSNTDVTEEPGTWLGLLAGADAAASVRPLSVDMSFSNSSFVDWQSAMTSWSWWSTSTDNVTWYDDSYMLSSTATISGHASDEELSVAELYSIYRPSIGLVDKCVTPIWYAIGFPGNLLSFAVWIRPRMRPSSGCYLAALAAGDFLFLLLHLVFELHAAWDVPTLKATFVCELFPVMFLALQYLSPLLVLAFTVER